MSAPTSARWATDSIRKQPMNRPQLNHVFENRYPALTDLRPDGGTPGLRYALIAAAAAGRYQSRGWQQVPRLPILTIRISEGPKSGDHSAILMSHGSAIAGASADNGVRHYFVDEALDDATGLGPAPQPEKPATPRPAKP